MFYIGMGLFKFNCFKVGSFSFDEFPVQPSDASKGGDVFVRFPPVTTYLVDLKTIPWTGKP